MFFSSLDTNDLILRSLYYLASLLIGLLVQMKTQVANGRKIVELKVLAPKNSVSARLAGGSGVQHVIQTKFAVVALLGRKLTGLNDPQFQHVVHPTTVVLRGGQRPALNTESFIQTNVQQNRNNRRD